MVMLEELHNPDEVSLHWPSGCFGTIQVPHSFKSNLKHSHLSHTYTSAVTTFLKNCLMMGNTSPHTEKFLVVVYIMQLHISQSKL
jgi:hypothetical protein